MAMNNHHRRTFWIFPVKIFLLFLIKYKFCDVVWVVEWTKKTEFLFKMKNFLQGFCCVNFMELNAWVHQGFGSHVLYESTREPCETQQEQRNHQQKGIKDSEEQLRAAWKQFWPIDETWAAPLGCFLHVWPKCKKGPKKRGDWSQLPTNRQSIR